MWIRSQNKYNLVNATYIRISSNESELYSKPSEYYIIANETVNLVNLGTYDTEERALEVLSIIQQRIANIETSKIIASNPKISLSDINPKVIVFEMPEK